MNFELTEEFVKYMNNCLLYFNFILHCVSIQWHACKYIAFTCIDQIRVLRGARHGFGTHNELVSSGQNELINPLETARVNYLRNYSRTHNFVCRLISRCKLFWTNKKKIFISLWKQNITITDWKKNRNEKSFLFIFFFNVIFIFLHAPRY